MENDRDDDLDEAIRRLVLLDRKINYLVGIVLSITGLGLAVGTYMLLESCSAKQFQSSQQLWWD